MSKLPLPKLPKKSSPKPSLPAGLEDPQTEKEKVERRREEILARGRRFKYPLQYAKHKIIISTVVIAILAVAALFGAGYLALYQFQDTSDMVYRVTRVLPISVANVDGENVLYSDYLMIYRSTITPVEQQTGQLDSAEDLEAMRAHYKRAALTNAEEYAYATKLARDLGITISDEQVDKAYESHRTAGGADRSEESFLKILSDNFNLSKAEYRRMLYLSLLKVAVAEKIDDRTAALRDQISAETTSGNTDLAAIAAALGDQVVYEETGGLVDLMNVDGGRAALAAKMAVGDVSYPVTSDAGDGYYFVKTTDKSEDGTQVAYASIKIPFTEFNSRLESLRKSGKIVEKITLTGDVAEE